MKPNSLFFKTALLAAGFLLYSSWASAYSSLLSSLVKTDFSGKADSLNTVFTNQFLNTQKGTFWSTPKDIDKASQFIYWQQAHAMDVLIYAYERHTKDGNSTMATRYKMYMNRWYNNKANNYSGGATGFENPFTDDMLWICLTLTHMSEALENNTYANTAKKVFDNTIMKRATEDEKGLWLPWNTDEGSGPNACTLAPACLLAAKFYLRYNDEKYLEYAEKFYEYLQKNICNTDGRVEEPPLTYTQGTMAEACRILYHITKKIVYKAKTELYLNYAFTSNRCTSNGLLRHEGTSMDQSLFKAVLIPYAVNFVLDEKMSVTKRRDIVKLLHANAEALWKNLDKEAYPNKMYCPYYWGEPYDASQTASMGAMASGASLLENVTRMDIALTTKDDETDIPSINAGNGFQTERIYNINGTPIWQQNKDNLPQGLYIIDGRKVYVR